MMHSILRFMTLIMVLVTITTAAMAQGGPGRGRGFGRGFGRGAGGPGRGGPGHGSDPRHNEDHEVFQFLLTHHEKITRKVTQLPNGVETLTESDDPEVADKIKEHVQWMEVRIKETNPIRMRDPLFAELFQHTDKITMKHEDTEKGVRVVETSNDPHVVKLIKAHAKVVSGFVDRGFAEAMKNHPVPGKTPSDLPEYSNPTVKNYGKVIRLAGAAQQPRDGSKLLVDLTRGGSPEKLNPAIEKVARYINLYHGGGSERAEVSIAVVLHGDATLAALNEDAYRDEFGVAENPNLDCLHELHEAGAAIYVCGQSLVAKGHQPEEVVVFAQTAVSALTAVVNLQADGYAYVPLAP